MDKEVNKVLSTTDYSKFKFMSSNREIKLSHVSELKESIKAHPLDKPIDVNEKMEIIDGQHRYFAWQELKMPIIYIIHKGWGEKEVPILNTNQKNWLPSDFVKMYCEHGLKDYEQYREFAETYGFTHHANLMLLANRGSEDRSKNFNEGKFKVTKWIRANLIAKQLIELKEYYPGYKRSNFISAYLNLASDPKFDHKVLMDKLSYQSRKLVDCTTTKEYYDLLLEIYNFRARNDTRIIKADF